MTTTVDSNSNRQMVGLFAIMVLVTIMPKELAYLVCVVVGAATYLLFLMLQQDMANVFKNKNKGQTKLAESDVSPPPCADNDTTITDKVPDDEDPPAMERKKKNQARFDSLKKQVFEHLASVEETEGNATTAHADVGPVTDIDIKESKLNANAVPFVLPGAQVTTDVASSSTRLSATAPPFIFPGQKMDTVAQFRPVPVTTSLNPAAKPFLSAQHQVSSDVSQQVTPVRQTLPVVDISKGPPGIWTRPVGAESPTTSTGTNVFTPGGNSVYEKLEVLSAIGGKGYRL